MGIEEERLSVSFPHLFYASYPSAPTNSLLFLPMHHTDDIRASPLFSLPNILPPCALPTLPIVRSKYLPLPFFTNRFLKHLPSAVQAPLLRHGWLSSKAKLTLTTHGLPCQKTPQYYSHINSPVNQLPFPTSPSLNCSPFSLVRIYNSPNQQSSQLPASSHH